MVIHARHNLHIVDKAAPSPSLAILYPFVGVSQSVVSPLSIPRILSINPSTVSTVHISNSGDQELSSKLCDESQVTEGARNTVTLRRVSSRRVQYREYCIRPEGESQA